MKAPNYGADELDLIAKHYPDIAFLIAHLPHRTAVGIRSKAKEMGLGRRSDLWAIWEDRALREHYPDRPKTQRALPQRSWTAIRSRAQLLGITKRRRVWSTERNEVLARLAGNVSDRAAAAMIGGTRVAISTQRRRLGLKGQSVNLPKPVILPVINDIREAAKAKSVMLTKITNALGCQKLKPSLTEGTVSVRSVVKVVRALGGELYVEWND